MNPFALDSEMFRENAYSFHRLYPAMNDTFVPSCVLCGRPGYLFGTRDRDTGWLGWCTICNAKWHTEECRKIIQCTQLVTRYCKSQEQSVTQAIVDFIAPNLREIQRNVMKCLFKRFLLGSSMAYFSDRYGGILEPDTEDELEDGVADPTLNYLNPLWKLRLVRTYGDFEIGCCSATIMIQFGRPFDLIIEFLGGIHTSGVNNPILLGITKQDIF